VITGMFNLNCSKKSKLIYIDELINKIFKILGLFEDNDNIIPIIYLNGLIMNINSANELFDGELINLIIKLNILITNKLNHKELRKIIFECINEEIPKIKNKINEGGI
jgi:hypothetical protein